MGARLATSQSHARQLNQTEAQVQAATAKFAGECATNYSLRKGVQRMEDTPSPPPNEDTYKRAKELTPTSAQARRTVMEDLWGRFDFDNPPLGNFFSSLSADEAAALVDKWRPWLYNARHKRAPNGSGMRTEHYKPTFAMAELEWACFFESIRTHNMPAEQRRYFEKRLANQLLKRDEDGRFTKKSKTRLIGLGCSTQRDATRGPASDSAKALGPRIRRYGQYAVASRCGGEAVQAGLQAGHDVDVYTTTLKADSRNAFCMLELDPAAEALLELEEEARADDDGDAAEAAIECLRDLVFYGCRDSNMIAVVEGDLRNLLKNRGVVQGHTFSMVDFCVAVAIKVLKVLKREFPKVAPLGIADDVHAQVIPKDVHDLLDLAAWACKYDELMIAIGQQQSWHKMQLLQSAEAIDTDLDIAKFVHLFPTDPATGKGPTIVRTCIDVNGIAMGPDRAARGAAAEAKVQIVEDRAKIMVHYAPSIGRQVTELYGRSCYKAGTTLNHLARGVEPDVNKVAMQRASEGQTRIFRTATGASEFYLPDTHGPLRRVDAGDVQPLNGATRCTCIRRRTRRSAPTSCR